MERVCCRYYWTRPHNKNKNGLTSTSWSKVLRFPSPDTSSATVLQSDDELAEADDEPTNRNNGTDELLGILDSDIGIQCSFAFSFNFLSQVSQVIS